MIRVLLVEDHPAVRVGVREALEASQQLAVVGDTDTAEEALHRLPALRPDVVYLDLRLPGLSGADAVAAVVDARPQVGVVALSVHVDVATLQDVVAAGARGVVTKSASPEALRRAALTVGAGETYLDEGLADVAAAVAVDGDDAGGPAGLTVREYQVVRELPWCQTNAEIADRLDIGVETVKTHLGNAMAKLGAEHRTQLAVIAAKKGLL